MVLFNPTLMTASCKNSYFGRKALLSNRFCGVLDFYNYAGVRASSARLVRYIRSLPEYQQHEQSLNTEGIWKNSNTFKNLNSQHPKKKNLYRQFDGSWTNRHTQTVLNPKYHKSCPPAKTLDTSIPNNSSTFLRVSRCVINMSSYEASVIH